MNNIQKEYLTKIKKDLPTSRKVKRNYINELSQSIEDYCKEHSDSTYDDICSVFGNPQDIAQAFLAEQDGNEMLRLKKRDKSKKIIILLFSIIIICAVIWFTLFTINSRALKSISSSETVSINSQNAVDLSVVPVQVLNGTQSESFLTENIICTNASKTITYYDKDENIICDCIITDEFFGPHIQNYKSDTEPKADVKMYNPKYSVKVKRLTSDNNCVNVVLTFKYNNYETEKLVAFSYDELK